MSGAPGPILRVAWCVAVLTAATTWSVFRAPVEQGGAGLYLAAFWAAVAGAAVCLVATGVQVLGGRVGVGGSPAARASLGAFLVSLTGAIVVVSLAPLQALDAL